jgi:hypothetical protein
MPGLVRTTKVRAQTASPAIRAKNKKREKKRAKAEGRKPRSPIAPTQTSKERHRLNHVQLAADGKPWDIKQLPLKRSATRGLQIAKSTDWISCYGASPVGASELPYIDRFGKYTGTNLYRCNFKPQQYIGTVISTIFRRLKFWILSKSRNKFYEFNTRQDVILRCAAYYALTKNDYFMNRILVLSKHLRQNWKTISSLVHKCSRKVDDNKWFVYSHACLQAKWLTIRAVRPRDKLTLINLQFPFRGPSIRRAWEKRANAYHCLWTVFNEVSQVTVNYTGPI